MFITILGSAAKQDATRECVSILVDSGVHGILFDVGPGIVSSLCRARRNAIDIDNLLLTHIHGDHILGFAYFIFTRNNEIKEGKASPDKDCSLTVYGYSDTIKLAKTMLEGAYSGLKLLFQLDFITLKETDKIQIDNSIIIDILPAIHAVPTLSSVIVAEGKKVVYSSDTLPNDELMALSQGADFVVHEGMFTNDNFDNSRRAKHATALDAGKFAAMVKTKHIALVHVASKMFGNEKDMLLEVSSIYDGGASIPYDGSVYVV